MKCMVVLQLIDVDLSNGFDLSFPSNEVFTMAAEKTEVQPIRSKQNSKIDGRQTNTRRTRKAPSIGNASMLASNDLIVVGIGASAGGLEAYKHVLPGLPTNANMAFVIVQHLDPKHRSMMASLLDRHTNMNLQEIVDGQTLEPNNVYITPPGRDVKIRDNTLQLSKPSSAIGPKPSIDYFFTSLAESKGDRAVGIVLSGTGSDGAHGIRAIKAGGGITIVQSEETARSRSPQGYRPYFADDRQTHRRQSGGV